MRVLLRCVKRDRYGSLVEQDAGAAGPTSVIAGRVRELRRRRDWTADQLAEQLSAVGVPWTRIVVTKLETGRRPSVSVEELFALAYVLNVSPMHLLVPDGDQGEPYAYVAGMATNRRTVREWIAGRRPIFGQDLNHFIGAVPSSDPDGFWDRFPELRAELQSGDDGER